MNTQKMPANVKFSTAGVHRSFDFIIHNAGHDTIPAGSNIYGTMLRDYSVIRCCTHGAGTLKINDTTYTVNPGDCYVILAGDVVSESAAQDSDFCLSYVTFLGIKSLPYFQTLGITSQSPFFQPNICSVCLDIIQTLSQEIGRFPARENAYYRCSKAYWAMHVLSEAMRSHTTPKQESKNVQEQYLDSALSFMENKYNTKISVSDIAAHIGINRSYFYTLFKQHTGISPQEYLTQLRINKACDLFKFSHATVANVANALGFESSVFFRHFKRITGVTPSEYKQRISESSQF